MNMTPGLTDTQMPPRHMAVVGMFDGVHRGHRYLLESLKREAATRGLTPMAVTFSNHPLDIIAPAKSPALLTSPDEKTVLLKEAGVEPVVLPFDTTMRDTGARDFLLMLKRDYGVDCMLLGFNNRFGHDAPNDFEAYKKLGLECGVEIVPGGEFKADGENVSSSEIRKAIGSGDVERGARLLGHPYSLTGSVGHGHRLGRTIGFPTANVEPAPGMLVPATGVYAAIAKLDDGSEFDAMVNIGHRPTVTGDASSPVTIEANLFDFTGNLYGSPLTLCFISRLRDERKFASIEDLTARLEADRRLARRRLAGYGL